MNFDEWFQSKQGTPYYSYYDFAKDAWNAAQAEEREACAKEGLMAASSDCEDMVAAAIRARGQK